MSVTIILTISVFRPSKMCYFRFHHCFCVRNSLKSRYISVFRHENRQISDFRKIGTPPLHTVSIQYKCLMRSLKFKKVQSYPTYFFQAWKSLETGVSLRTFRRTINHHRFKNCVTFIKGLPLSDLNWNFKMRLWFVFPVWSGKVININRYKFQKSFPLHLPVLK